MNPKEQRLAIAKVCGWSWMTKYGSSTSQHFNKYSEDSIRELKLIGFIEGQHGEPELSDIYGIDSVPDYLNDLNAMHQVEKKLQGVGYDWTQYSEYCRQIYDITKRDGQHPYSATAAQRAEAFLKTLNLWKDED